MQPPPLHEVRHWPEVSQVKLHPPPEQLKVLVHPQSIVHGLVRYRDGSVVAQMAPHLPSHVSFIPAHPVAGTEHSGPDAGFVELFDDPIHAFQVHMQYKRAFFAV